MDDKITVSAKTLDEAITKALIELQTTSDHLQYEVVQKESSGFLGFIGAKPCVIRARVMSEEEERKIAAEKAAAEKAAAKAAAEKAAAEKAAKQEEGKIPLANEWKRTIGIAIACNPPEPCPYPIKIIRSEKSWKYQELYPSKITQ